MSRPSLTEIGGYIRQHWRRLGLYGLGGVVVSLVIVQLALPWNNLPLYQTIDGVDVSGQDISATIKKLDSQYKKMPINLYFGNSPKTYRQPVPADIGLTISSAQQVESASYPFWMRLIPTSLWWAHRFVGDKPPVYKHDTAKVKTYVQKELGTSCDVKAVNATLKYDKKLVIVPAIDGGTCKLEDVERLLATASPNLQSSNLRVAMVQHPTKVHNGIASVFAQKLTAQTKDGVVIWAGSQLVTVPQNDMLSWLDFESPDTGLVAKVNVGRANDFFTKQLSPKVSATAGTSYVTTLDFTETARVDGPSGKTIDVDGTAAALNGWLLDPSKRPVTKTKTVDPTVIYKRTYSATDTGITALITQYAQSHPGTFGVSYVELDGQRRHAGYNDTKTFQTASTYKLFVAYSTLKRIESGAWHWSDQISGGKDATRCFNDMIRLSDNACAEAFLNKIGFNAITKEIQAVGLTHSSFLKSYPQTTPADLATYLGALQSGQLLSASSTSTLISVMKQNVYRQGIPAGSSGTVADKVGFLNPGSIEGVAGTVNLLHDAAIVYGAKGTYVLVVMTGNSSWATIADLTRQIETLRAQ